MNVHLSETPVEGAVRHTFACPKGSSIKSMTWSATLNHPSLRAKKFDETKGRWQTRVNDDWRFYFTIERNTYRISKVIPHPK
jgi:plasmid maintenance system killer protein